MIAVSPAVHSVRQEFMEGKPMIIFKKSKTEKVDFFKQRYDGVTMRGAQPEDTKIIYQAVQNGEKLTEKKSILGFLRQAKAAPKDPAKKEPTKSMTKGTVR